jgi:hypothetical protein
VSLKDLKTVFAAVICIIWFAIISDDDDEEGAIRQ